MSYNNAAVERCGALPIWPARFGEILFGSLMVYSAIMHYKFATFVAQIVPSWLPWHLFWAYFTGLALLTAGVSIVLRRQVWLSAPLLGLMLFFCLADSRAEHDK